MNCNQIRELLPDLASLAWKLEQYSRRLVPISHPVTTVPPICANCRKPWRCSMSGKRPNRRPISTPACRRASAKSREEMARPHAAWFRWLRRPAWAMSLTAVIFAGALLVGNKSYISQTEAIATKPPSLGLPVEPGTAVGDLQALDTNNDLYADFDVLDDLQVQDEVTANP